LPRNKPPFLSQPANHFATTLTEPVSSQYNKASKISKTVILRIIKFLRTITQYFLSYGSLVQILTDNNRQESKTSSQTAVENTILRLKKE
jgi:hypothetical protein